MAVAQDGREDLDRYSASRLATVSASALLQAASQGVSGRSLSTGIRAIDIALRDGIPRRSITELWGPPGVGKTALCLQLARHTLGGAGSVTWIDADPLLAPKRKADLLDGVCTRSSPRRQWNHWRASSLAHLFALIHPSSCAIPSGTALLVIDEISSLFMAAYPRANVPGPVPPRDSRRRSTHVQSQWTQWRRQAVHATLVQQLNRLAEVHDLAVLLVNQSTTRVRKDVGFAVLEPATSSLVGEEGIRHKVMLFRDAPLEFDRPTGPNRFVSVTKPGIRFSSHTGASDYVTPLSIVRSGLQVGVQSTIDRVHKHHMVRGVDRLPRKRAFEELCEPGDDECMVYGDDSDLGWDEEEWEFGVPQKAVPADNTVIQPEAYGDESVIEKQLGPKSCPSHRTDAHMVSGA